VNVTIKNTSEFIYYQDGDHDPIISLVSGDASKFFINNVWLSPTQAEFVKDSTVLKSGETGVFPVRLNVPLYFGEQSEQFQFSDITGKIFPGTKFTLKLNVKHPEKEVVEIIPTETGQLNVREAATSYSRVIGRVTPGQRFFVLERNNSGWVKLDNGEKSGWVVAKYTKVV